MRLAGGLAFTEGLLESNRSTLGRKGRKLEVICRDCGGAGGSLIVCGESLKLDNGGGEVDGVGTSGPYDDLRDWLEVIGCSGTSRWVFGGSFTNDVDGGGPEPCSEGPRDGPKKLSKAV